MKNFPPFTLGLACFLTFAGHYADAAEAADELIAPPPARAMPSVAFRDRYIVETVVGSDAAAVADSHGAAVDHVFRHAARGFAGIIPPGRLAALRADPRVLQVIPDRQVSAIARSSSGTVAVSTQMVPAGVKRVGAAPGAVAYNGSGVGVAVVDTGLDFNHADLKPFGAVAFTAFGTSAADDNGHGTHVAGIIAARNNGVDVVGVAPAATLYAVKVLDTSGNGSDATVIAGLDWIAQNAALVRPAIRVVNLSLSRAGNLGDNPILRSSIAALHSSGVAVVVAAGNDATLEVSQQVPAAYPEVIAVASTTALAGTNQNRTFSGVIGADTASYFTSDGSAVAVSAPGEEQENIDKTGVLSSVGILSTKLGGGTTRMSGTSMAAPHVAGMAALAYQKNPSLGAEDIRDRVSVGAVNQGIAPLNSPTGGYTFDGTREGILNAPGVLAAP